jgi:hypothetical protein
MNHVLGHEIKGRLISCLETPDNLLSILPEEYSITWYGIKEIPKGS